MQVPFLNNLIDLDSNSPDGNFSYVISEPKEITHGNWGCRIKILDKLGNTIYYNPKTYAHNLSSSPDEFRVIEWSADSSVALIYEFRYGEVYDLVYLLLRRKQCLRVNLLLNSASITDRIEKLKESSESEVLAFVNADTSEAFEVNERFSFSSLFGRWYH
jgi:hypothetical protein